MNTSYAIVLLHTALDTVKSEHDEILKNIEKMKKMIEIEEARLEKLAKKMQEIQESLIKLEQMPILDEEPKKE